MKYQFRNKEHMRDCDVDERQVYCPNASMLGYATRTAKPGMLVVYREHYTDGTSGGRLARVLGRITWARPLDPPFDKEDRDVRGFLLVLALSDDGTFAYIRWIDPKDVMECHATPTDFARWFFQPKLPPADVCVALANYGTLSESYISDPTCGPASTRGKDGRGELFGWDGRQP